MSTVFVPALDAIEKTTTRGIASQMEKENGNINTANQFGLPVK